jgi:hypothetical protein
LVGRDLFLDGRVCPTTGHKYTKGTVVLSGYYMNQYTGNCYDLGDRIYGHPTDRLVLLDAAVVSTTVVCTYENRGRAKGGRSSIPKTLWGRKTMITVSL